MHWRSGDTWQKYRGSARCKWIIFIEINYCKHEICGTLTLYETSSVAWNAWTWQGKKHVHHHFILTFCDYPSALFLVHPRKKHINQPSFDRFFKLNRLAERLIYLNMFWGYHLFGLDLLLQNLKFIFESQSNLYVGAFYFSFWSSSRWTLMKKLYSTNIFRWRFGRCCCCKFYPNREPLHVLWMTASPSSTA